MQFEVMELYGRQAHKLLLILITPETRELFSHTSLFTGQHLHREDFLPFINYMINKSHTLLQFHDRGNISPYLKEFMGTSW